MELITNNLSLFAVVLLVALLLYLLSLLYESMRSSRMGAEVAELQLQRFLVDLDRAKSEHLQQQKSSLSWSSFRKFDVVDKVFESADKQICSFYLQPHDLKEIPTFKPGQHLTFSLDEPGLEEDLLRFYTLSDIYREKNGVGQYRVSIKRMIPPSTADDKRPGRSSNYFHDHVKVGSILDVGAPKGGFYLDVFSERSIVLIAGGVGITPIITMLNTLVEQGTTREVWIFYGVRNSNELCFKDQLFNAAKSNPKIHLHICFNAPLSEDKLGSNYHHKSWVGIDLFKELLPSNNFQFLMCGPPPMMKSITKGLTEWKVPESDIFQEAFGPASVKRKPIGANNLENKDIKIEFRKSGVTLPWDGKHADIIKLAKASGIKMKHVCLMGKEGCCKIAVVKGSVAHAQDADLSKIEDGSCLPCSCVPTENLTLDA